MLIHIYKDKLKALQNCFQSEKGNVKNVQQSLQKRNFQMYQTLLPRTQQWSILPFYQHWFCTFLAIICISMAWTL